MQQLFKQAKDLQDKMTKLQAEFDVREIDGSAGSGAVKVVMTLKGTVKSVNIDASLMNEDEKDMLEDLIVAALNDAKSKADTIMTKETEAVSGNMNIPGMKGLL